MFKGYLRWRHSRGYGVHSPYAYRFVTDVARPGKYMYYSFEEINDFLKDREIHDYRFVSLVKFIIRLAMFLKTRRIVTFSPQARFAGVAAKAMGITNKCVGKTEEFEFHEGDFLIAVKDSPDKDVLAEAIEKNIPVYALEPAPQERALLENPIRHGVLIKDRKALVLIPRAEMEYVAYDMLLPHKKT